jgi:hypothetical protein
MTRIVSLLGAVAASFFWLAPAALADTVILRALDKTTGVAQDLSVPIDKPVQFGTLTITAKSCSKRAPEETPEVYAYLEIDDKPLVDANQQPVPEHRIFSGWMFWSSPALNPLEHPSYDVWVIDCKT